MSRVCRSLKKSEEDLKERDECIKQMQSDMRRSFLAVEDEEKEEEEENAEYEEEENYNYNQDYGNYDDYTAYYDQEQYPSSPEMAATGNEEQATENALKLLRETHGSVWKDSQLMIPHPTVAGTPNPAGPDPDAHEKLRELRVPPFPKDAEYRPWTMAFFQAVNCATRQPVAALAWLRKYQTADSVEDLAGDEPFITLSRKISSAINNIFYGTFKSRAAIKQDEYFQKTGSLMNGRQVMFLMHEYFMRGGGRNTLNEFRDLLGVKLQNDKLRQFLNEWDWTLGGMEERPSDKILEQLFRQELEKSVKFQFHLSVYNNEILTKKMKRSYVMLHSYVENYLTLQDQSRPYQKLGDPVLSYAAKDKGKGKGRSSSKGKGKGKGKSSKGKGRGKSQGPGKNEDEQREKQDCRDWVYKGTCPRGSRCGYNHDPNKRGTRLGKPYDPNRPRSPGLRKPSPKPRPRGQSPSGKDNRFSCNLWLKRRCKKETNATSTM